MFSRYYSECIYEDECRDGIQDFFFFQIRLKKVTDMIILITNVPRTEMEVDDYFKLCCKKIVIIRGKILIKGKSFMKSKTKMCPEAELYI